MHTAAVAPMAIEPRKMQMKTPKAAPILPPVSPPASGVLKASTVRASTIATASLSTLSPKTIAKMSSRTPGGERRERLVLGAAGGELLRPPRGSTLPRVRSVVRRRARSLQTVQRGRWGPPSLDRVGGRFPPAMAPMALKTASTVTGSVAEMSEPKKSDASFERG